jgi:S-formylglutathione hydrolase
VTLQIHHAEFDDVPYAVLTPADWDRGERLPLIVVLHGANSSRDVLTMLQPIAEGLDLPRSVLACASTPTVGGFYLGRWESVVAVGLVGEVEKRFGIDAGRVSLMGASMGGFGALRIAFADPYRWQAVAATAPALLPGHAPGARNTVGVLADLARATGEGDLVLERLTANAEAVRASKLPIMLRCGDNDMFALQDGTEQLHRALWDLDISHDYHLVRDGDHLGPEALNAQRAALTFIGEVQLPPGRDADREWEAAWRAWDGTGTPPEFDAFGVSGPVAARIMYGIRENARRYGSW